MGGGENGSAEPAAVQPSPDFPQGQLGSDHRVSSSAGPSAGGGLFCCVGGIVFPTRLSSHLESARETLRQGKGYLHVSGKRQDTEHEPRAASNQDK